jgi:Seryl-tRNA synthetase
VLLEYALVRWVMETLKEKGFTPVVPPAMISYKAMKAMGYIDSEKDLAERYYFPQDDLFLIGTAEQPLAQCIWMKFWMKAIALALYCFFSLFSPRGRSMGKILRNLARAYFEN